MKISRKLQSIYFQWADNSVDQRWQWDDSFEKYLYMCRYDFSESWLEKIIAECEMLREEFAAQVIVIGGLHDVYRKQQNKKYERKRKKEWNKICAKSHRLGILPF